MSDELVRTNTEIEKACQNRLLDVLSRYKKSIDSMLPQMIDPKRFAYLAVTAVRQNPALAQCSPASFLNSVMLATQMGLEIRRDSAYLIPFGKECQLLIDYKGKMGLARRSGKVGGIQAFAIRENDDFEWAVDIGGIKMHHRPHKGTRIKSPEERGKLVGVYAFAQLTDGGTQFREPMSVQEIERVRKRSRAGVNYMSFDEIMSANELTADGKIVWQTWEFKDRRRQPWVTDYESMALKTALHSLFKGLPLDPAAQMSQEVDDGYDTGNQPNILADAVDIDPVDEKPMVETTDREGVQAVADQRIAELGGDPPDKRKPTAATLSELKRFRKPLGDQAWFTLIGNSGYSSLEEIPTEAAARKLKSEMQRAEADRG